MDSDVPVRGVGSINEPRRCGGTRQVTRRRVGGRLWGQSEHPPGRPAGESLLSPSAPGGWRVLRLVLQRDTAEEWLSSERRVETVHRQAEQQEDSCEPDPGIPGRELRRDREPLEDRPECEARHNREETKARENEEISRPTGASRGAVPAGATGPGGESVARVGASEGELIAAPQERQNLSEGDSSPEQEEHCIQVLRSSFTATDVFGLLGGMNLDDVRIVQHRDGFGFPLEAAPPPAPMADWTSYGPRRVPDEKAPTGAGRIGSVGGPGMAELPRLSCG